MTFSLNRLLELIAVICFAIALALTTGTVFHSGNATAWGLRRARAGSFLP